MGLHCSVRVGSHLSEDLLGEASVASSLFEDVDDLLEGDILSEGTLLEFLEDLHGQVVEFNLIKLFLNFELDLEFLSKLPSSRSVEREGGNMVWLSAVCGELSIFLDLQWD